ncbi:Efflux pump atB [Colletotrichum trifolii]|uniref:Efflux pump atB n=1 Tax=Colletotrichum trifolii TaxID=5466 RepID=A0A4R8RVZ5_COLTR|nr:Efflux pump atB [Colletotrichum trifolii]
METERSNKPDQAINQADLDMANEKLQSRDDRPSGSSANYNQPKIETSDNDEAGIDRQGSDDDKREITEDDCYDELGYSFSTWKKWSILTVIFWVQVSMNFNTSLYSNAIPGITEEFSVSAQGARCGAMIFLVMYAFGCELWAPWSEEFGRRPVLQLSLLFVNIFQLPVALAPNFATIMVGRALGGLASAGGSVTLGMIADMFESDAQQYAVAYVVFSSVFGSVLGPIVGGFSEQYLHWRWSIWIQLIFGGAVQLLHFFVVPETRTTIMMNRIAKKRRKEGKTAEERNIWGPDELVPFRERFSAKEVVQTWVRPFKMFLTEPIVLVLSLLSGFSDALIFMFIQSFALVYEQWNFDAVQVGLAFVPIGIGYAIAWALFIPAIKRNMSQRAKFPQDEKAQYESRLWFLLWTAPCLPIGLIGFAWTIQGPPIHWIGSMIFASIVGIANYAIYMATIDYMICAYGPYSASATGGNGWARDFLAGVLTVPATPFFQNIGRSSGKNLSYASTILACISFFLVAAVYVIYWKGPQLRQRSPFAQKLASAREEVGGRRLSYVADEEGTGPVPKRPTVPAPAPAPASASAAADGVRPPNKRTYSHNSRFFGEARVTPRATPRGTPSASRANSPTRHRIVE